MNIPDWIEQNLSPPIVTMSELIYDEIESQSGRYLPIIYQPFDINNRAHWRDRGSVFDFLYATGGGRLLDFGPGDGWPSLVVAPFVDKIVGVDSSERRVRVCGENATRLEISNAEFVHVTDGESLPFGDNSFDGIMAASSIEETLDINATLRELHRVLKPGGRMRIFYDSLKKYGGAELDVWPAGIDENHCRLLLEFRHIEKEEVTRYGLTVAAPREKLINDIAGSGNELKAEMITVSLLESLRDRITDAGKSVLAHPSGATFVSWLQEVGFTEIHPTYSGADFTGRLFDVLPPDERPGNLEAVDEYIREPVKVYVTLEAPVDSDPMITAVK